MASTSSPSPPRKMMEEDDRRDEVYRILCNFGTLCQISYEQKDPSVFAKAIQPMYDCLQTLFLSLVNAQIVLEPGNRTARDCIKNAFEAFVGKLHPKQRDVVVVWFAVRFKWSLEKMQGLTPSDVMEVKRLFEVLEVQQPAPIDVEENLDEREDNNDENESPHQKWSRIVGEVVACGGPAAHNEAIVLAAAAQDNTVRVFDVHGTQCACLTGHASAVVWMQVVTCYRGRRIITGTQCGTLRVWEADGAYSCLCEIKAPAGATPKELVCFLALGDTCNVVLKTRFSEVVVWNMAASNEWRFIPDPMEPSSTLITATMDPSAKHLACCQKIAATTVGSVTIWDIARRELVHRCADRTSLVKQLYKYRAGQRFFTRDNESQHEPNIFTFDNHDGNHLLRFLDAFFRSCACHMALDATAAPQPMFCALRKQDNCMSLIAYKFDQARSEYSEVYIYKAVDEARFYQPCQMDICTDAAMCVSADGLWVACGAKHLVVIDIMQKRRKHLKDVGNVGRVTFLRFSPDAQRLFTAHRDGTVRCWECDTLNIVYEFKVIGGVSCLFVT